MSVECFNDIPEFPHTNYCGCVDKSRNPCKVCSISSACPTVEYTVGDVVSIQLTVVGGVPPYTWTLIAGSFPTELTLSSGGLISGTITESGTFSWTVRVRDANGESDIMQCAFVIEVNSSPSLYITDYSTLLLRKITLPVVNVTTLAGQPETPGFDNGIGIAATFYSPGPLWGDSENLYIADTPNNAIRKYEYATGNVSTFVVVTLSAPFGLWGNGLYLYWADLTDKIIYRALFADGIPEIFTDLWTTVQDSHPSGHNTTGARPRFICGDNVNLYINTSAGPTDGSGNVWGFEIWKIPFATGTPEYIAGGERGGASPYGHVDGIGDVARFDAPKGMWAIGDALYVCDGSDTVRKVIISTGEVTTISGTAYVFGGPWNVPSLIWSAGDDFLYITNSFGPTIRRLQISISDVITIAGLVDESGYVDGDASVATFEEPGGIWGKA